MLNPAQYTQIAKVLFKSSNPWEKWENAEEGVRMNYLEQAENLVELLYDAGFNVVEGGHRVIDNDGGGSASGKK